LLLGNLHTDRQFVTRTDGFVPPELVDARRAYHGVIFEEAVDHETHRHRGGMPSARNQTAEERITCRLFVDVHRLRVVLPRELDDLVPRHLVGSELPRVADL